MTTTHYFQTKWNVTTGCNCTSCFIHPYSEYYSKYDNIFKNKSTPTTHADLLKFPGEWRTPRLIEISPYSDLFNPAFNSDFIKQVFTVVKNTPHHIYLLTTKYPARASNAANVIGWPTNLWCGTTIEENKYIDRLDFLATVPALIKYVDFLDISENINIFNIICPIDFVTYTQPTENSWTNSIKTECQKHNIPLIKKTLNNEFPTLKETELDMLYMSIDSTKAPSLWTIEWRK